MSKKFIFIDTDGNYEQSNPGAFEIGDHLNVSAGAGDAGKPIILNINGKVDPSMIDLGSLSHDSLADVTNSTAHTAFSLLDGTRDYTQIVSYNAAKNFTSASGAAIVDKNYVDMAIMNAGTAAEWQESVLDILLSPPVSPNTGDRYLINGTGSGAWAGKDYQIAEWDGSAWIYTVPNTGTYVSVDDEIDGIYYFGGTGPWIKKYYESTTASLGCQKVGIDIRADLYASGGLKLIGNEIAVEPNDFVGEGLIDDGSDNIAIDWSTLYNDSKAVKASDLSSTANGKGASIIGIEDATSLFTATNVESALVEVMGKANDIYDNTITSPNSTISISGTIGANDTTVDINWSTTFTDAKAVKAEDLNSITNGEGASIIGIEDAGGYTSATNVEGALQEIYGVLSTATVNYIVDTGGVNKGDLVYISSNDTVKKLDITTSSYGAGLAATTQLATESVKLLNTGNVISGVLSGATAGTRYYWNGSTITSVRPSASGNYVWLVGIAKNATDLLVHVEFLYRVA